MVEIHTNNNDIKELYSKTLESFKDKDFLSVITKSRTLLETCFVSILKKYDCKDKAAAAKGNINKLFKEVKRVYKLDQFSQGDKANQILGAFSNIINAIASLRNNNSDAHAAINSQFPEELLPSIASLVIDSTTIIVNFFEEIDKALNNLTSSTNLNYYELLIINQIDFSKSGQLKMLSTRAIKPNEYTDNRIIKHVYTREGYLSDNIISYPVIFGNEISHDPNQLFYYGKITSFAELNNGCFLIKYNIRGSISKKSLLEHKDELLIGDYELCRTHWALKRSNAIKLLNLKI